MPMESSKDQLDNIPELPLKYPFPRGALGTPPPLVHWARENHPVCPIELPSGADAWMLTRRSDIEAVFTDRRFSRELAFHGAPRLVGDDTTSVPGSIFNLDPPDHTRVRRTISTYYTRLATEKVRSTISAIVHRRIDEILESSGHTVDLVRSFALPLPPLIACALLKIGPDMAQGYAKWFAVQTAFLPDSDGRSEAKLAISNFTKEIIEQRRADNGADREDPVGSLVTAYEQGILSADEMYATAAYLIVTAAGSLVSPLATGPLTLILHGDQLRQCLADGTLWPRAAEEVLRYHHNGVLGLPRIAIEDVELHGVTIRRGDAVTATMLGSTWDPEHYLEPERFNIHRPENADATFGAGPHYCLGAQQARLVLSVAYEALFKRLPELRLAVSEKEIKFDESNMFTVPEVLPVQWG
jgi:cytochrome P450